MVAGPTDGEVAIDQWQGAALFDEFLIEAKSWLSFAQDTEELTYQYFYRDKSDRKVALAPAEQGQTAITTILPETDEIYVKATDSLGGEAWASTDVRIRIESIDAGTTQPSPSDFFYDGFQAKINESLDDATASVVDACKSLAPWTASLDVLGESMTEQQVHQISRGILQVLSLGLEEMGTLASESQSFMTKITALQLSQTVEACQKHTENIELISDTLKILDTIQSEYANWVVEEFKQDSQEQDLYIGLISNIFDDIQDYSYGLDQSSTSNNTLKI